MESYASRESFEIKGLRTLSQDEVYLGRRMSFRLLGALSKHSMGTLQFCPERPRCGNPWKIRLGAGRRAVRLFACEAPVPRARAGRRVSAHRRYFCAVKRLSGCVKNCEDCVLRAEARGSRRASGVRAGGLASELGPQRWRSSGDSFAGKVGGRPDAVH